MRRWSGATIVLAGALCASPACADVYNNYANGGSTTFMSLGFLTGPSPESKALGISADGRSVVGYSRSSNDYQAFSLQLNYSGTLGGPVTAGPMISLGGLTPSPSVSQASGASNTGLAVGYSNTTNTPGPYEGFVVQTSGTGIQTLPPLVSGVASSQAFGINSAGTRIVGQAGRGDLSGTQEAVFWDMSGGNLTGPTVLPNYAAAGPEGYQIVANSVTGNGSIVVGYGVNGSGENQATYWKIDANGVAGQPQGLPFLPAFVNNAQATSVSPNTTDPSSAPDSFITVGTSLSTVGPNQTLAGQAVSWTVDSSITKTVPLGFLVDPQQNPSGPFQSNANGVSDSKGYLTTVVGSSIGPNPDTQALDQEAFTLVLGNNDPNNPPVMQNLKAVLNNGQYALQIPVGWRLVEATAVSADGNTVVGYGINPNGQTEAWVVVLATPEPGSLILLPIAIGSLLKRRPR